jgi:hypothetical protein
MVSSWSCCLPLVSSTHPHLLRHTIRRLKLHLGKSGLHTHLCEQARHIRTCLEASVCRQANSECGGYVSKVGVWLADCVGTQVSQWARSWNGRMCGYIHQSVRQKLVFTDTKPKPIFLGPNNGRRTYPLKYRDSIFNIPLPSLHYTCQKVIK